MPLLQAEMRELHYPSRKRTRRKWEPLRFLCELKCEKLADARLAARKRILRRNGMKRLFVFLTVGLLAGSVAQAQKFPCAAAGDNNDFLGVQTIRLWPGNAPQAKGATAALCDSKMVSMEPESE